MIQEVIKDTTPFTLISEKDKGRLLSEHLISKFLLVSGSERQYGNVSLSNTRKASQDQKLVSCALQSGFFKILKILKKKSMSESCFSNITLWFHQNRTPPWIFSEACSDFPRDLYLYRGPKNTVLIGLHKGNCLKCNWRNIVTALRKLVKPYKWLQETEKELCHYCAALTVFKNRYFCHLV